MANPSIKMSNQVIDKIKYCLMQEAKAISVIADGINDSLSSFIKALSECKGKRFFTGVGKSYLVASKIASSFCSLGYASISVDPLRLLHGELGAVSEGDILIAISNSGETDILLDAVRAVKKRNIAVISIVGNGSSSLAMMSKYSIAVPTSEAGPFGLVPSTSTTVMMAMGDALLCGLAEMDKLTVETFKSFHPDGHLGQIMKGL